MNETITTLKRALETDLERLGWKQEQLGDNLGISQQAIAALTGPGPACRDGSG